MTRRSLRKDLDTSKWNDNEDSTIELSDSVPHLTVLGSKLTAKRATVHLRNL